jgi:class 3 adenylate cyclase
MELKRSGKVDAVKFDQVTVLFTDFVEFTKIAEHVEPVQLVKSIDYYFKGFDEITTKYGLEKIKTVGDSYMCACGLPTVNKTHARNVMIAAKEMIDLVRNEMSALDGLNHFEVRIGVHTGPVVAGIVGIKKWQYDIWGDTENIASRMESMTKPGRVNLSETTYLEIKDEFQCEYRGEIKVKHHGAMKMYFLS